VIIVHAVHFIFSVIVIITSMMDGIVFLVLMMLDVGGTIPVIGTNAICIVEANDDNAPNCDNE